MTAESASLLHALQPLAGAALALNMAYLNLKKFRYQNIISESARGCLESLRGEKNYNQDQEEADYFLELEYLAAFPEGGGDNADKRNTGRKNCPKKLWANSWVKLYACFYIPHWDVKICAVAACVSVLAFVFGSGHSVGLLNFSEFLFQSERIVWTFWPLVLSAALPAAFVVAGDLYVVRGARSQIEYNREQAEIFLMKKDAKRVKYSQE